METSVVTSECAEGRNCDFKLGRCASCQPQISMDAANRDCTVYLISDQDADNDKTLARWIKANYATV